MAHCVIPNCGSRLQDKRGVSFHEFPCRGQRREEWIRVVQAVRHCGPDDLWYPGEKSRVCSRHFLPEDYRQTSKRTRLCPDAIPSVFPGRPDVPAGKDAGATPVSQRGRVIKRTFVLEKKKKRGQNTSVESERASAEVGKQTNENCGPSANNLANRTIIRRRPPNILRVSRVEKAQTPPEKCQNTAVPTPEQPPPKGGSAPTVVRIGDGGKRPPAPPIVHIIKRTQSPPDTIAEGPKVTTGRPDALRPEAERRKSVGCQTTITCHGIDNQRNRIVDLQRQYEALQSVLHRWEVKNAQLAKEIQKLRPQEADRIIQNRPRETTLFLKKSDGGSKRKSVTKAKPVQKVVRLEDWVTVQKEKVQEVEIWGSLEDTEVQESLQEVVSGETPVVRPLLVPDSDMDFGREKETRDNENGSSEVSGQTED